MLSYDSRVPYLLHSPVNTLPFPLCNLISAGGSKGSPPIRHSWPRFLSSRIQFGSRGVGRVTALLPTWQIWTHSEWVSECYLLSSVQFFATPWTVAHQVPLSMELSRQEYWSGLSFPFPRDLPDPGIKPGSPALQADALPSEPPGIDEYLFNT